MIAGIPPAASITSRMASMTEYSMPERKTLWSTSQFPSKERPRKSSSPPVIA
jgi:hypothetical protein